MEFSMLKIKGLDLKVSDLYMGKTYASLLEGKPDADLHAGLLTDFIEQARRMFGNENPYVLYPNTNFTENLPDVVVFIRLEYFGVFKKLERDFSTLTVICFTNEFKYPLPASLVSDLANVPFEELSEEHYI